MLVGFALMLLRLLRKAVLQILKNVQRTIVMDRGGLENVFIRPTRILIRHVLLTGMIARAIFAMEQHHVNIQMNPREPPVGRELRSARASRVMDTVFAYKSSKRQIRRVHLMRMIVPRIFVMV